MRKLTEKEAYPVFLVKVTGRVRHGKSTGMAAIAEELLQRKGKNANIVVWNPDGRPQDFTMAVGIDRVLVPEANPTDTTAVLKEIQAEAKKGTFNNTAALYIDTLTQLWEKALKQNVGGAKALSKSDAMANIRAVVIEFSGMGIPVFIATHVRKAATKATIADNSFKQERRESISDTELERILGLTWLDVEFFRTGPDPDIPGTNMNDVKYGISVRACRFRTSTKIPFRMMDTTENRTNETYWHGLLERLESSLWGSGEKKVDVKELTWEDYGLEEPFPTPERAISIGVRHFITDERFEGMKFYPWGDPDEQRIRKDGTTGNSSATSHATRTYNAISPNGTGVQPETKKKYAEKYGRITSPGQMAVAWKKEVEERCRLAVEAFAASLEEEQPDDTGELPVEEDAESIAAHEESVAESEAEALADAITEDEEHPEPEVPPVEEEVRF